jgi:hypothetical protein
LKKQVSIIENGIFLLFFCCYIPRMQSAETTGRQNDLKHAEEKTIGGPLFRKKHIFRGICRKKRTTTTSAVRRRQLEVRQLVAAGKADTIKQLMPPQ